MSWWYQVKNQNIGELIFIIFFAIISIVGCILLLMGTFGKSYITLTYSALCFAVSFGSFAFYFLRKKNIKCIIFFVLALLCAFLASNRFLALTDRLPLSVLKHSGAELLYGYPSYTRFLHLFTEEAVIDILLFLLLYPVKPGFNYTAAALIYQQIAYIVYDIIILCLYQQSLE